MCTLLCGKKKLIYKIYHLYGSGKRSVFPVLGVTAFSGEAFCYVFRQNMTLTQDEKNVSRNNVTLRRE